MRKFIFAILLLLTSFLPSALAQEKTDSNTLYYFYGQGCAHCTTVNKFFEENSIQDKYRIDKREVYSNEENVQLFTAMMSARMDTPRGWGVPSLIAGDRVLTGSTTIINFFEDETDELTNYLLSESVEPAETPTPGTPMYIGPAVPGEEPDLNDQGEAPEETAEPAETTHQPMGLTLAAVVAASIVDAINPCAFAVLIILLITVSASAERKRALKCGIAFSTAIFISYMLMGLGLLTVFSNAPALSLAMYSILGWLAIILGLLNLKDWAWYGKGCLMEVPLSWRPKLKKIIQSVTSPSGAFFVGFAVSLILLPCTSGPYFVILGMLANKTTQVEAFKYLVLYNLIFILPMLIITFLVYKGLEPERVEKLREKHMRTLHLIAGLILLALGLFLVFF